MSLLTEEWIHNALEVLDSEISKTQNQVSKSKTASENSKVFDWLISNFSSVIAIISGSSMLKTILS